MTGMPKNKYVEPGTKFFDFTFLRYTRSVNGDMRGLFHCMHCGEERERVVSHVRTGYVKTCHCQNGVQATKHGHAKSGFETPTYEAWSAMKKRCLNPTHRHFKDYGGRGITVCERWLKFENFLEDMGERPNDHSLDRVDNNSGYSPENCRWATMQQQNNNRRNNTWIEHGGKTMTITQWARHLGIKKNTLIERFRNGWSVERALTTAPRNWGGHTTLPPEAT